MATVFKEGDRVRIVDREATAEDAKTGTFYNFFRGLVGSVQKAYPNDDVAVAIDIDCLPEGAARRHTDVQEQMKSKWMDGLSEDARNRLTEKERDFRLTYAVLVAAKDLVAGGPALPKAPAAQETRAIEQPKVSEARRQTLEEIAANELAELERHRKTDG